MTTPESAPKTRGRVIRWARLYDIGNRLLFLGREASFREATVDLGRIEPGHRVLDVGCGTGNVTLAAARRAGPSGAVFGIDAAPEMIREASRKAERQKTPVEFRVGLVEDLPFEDGQFDVVLSSLMLHHLPADLKRKGIAEIGRVLKPGGRFAAVDFDPPLIRNMRIVRDTMDAVGFIEMRTGRTKLWVVSYIVGSKGAFDNR
jgi:ubiquinone/menaquinone biosynthesis C-methylase UbiE